MKTALLILTLFASSCGHTLSSAGAGFRVESNVPDATVWIDDSMAGTATDWQRDGKRIRPGFHRIEIRHPNYYSVFQEIDAASGGQSLVRAHLQPLLP
jgi:hypothetical protein